MTAWTEEEDRDIARMIAEGRPASMIGAAIGRSRNSVISRSHRLKLTWGAAGVRPQQNRGAASAAPRAASRSRSPKLAAPPGTPLPPIAVRTPMFAVDTGPPGASSPPPGKRKSILDLEPHECKWPSGGGCGDLDFGFYCRSMREIDLPYCGAHCREAYSGVVYGRLSRRV